MSGLTFTFSANFSRATGGAGGTCGTSLNAGSSCTVNLVFASAAPAGAKSGTLTIGTSSTVPAPAAVSLNGTSTLPVAATVAAPAGDPVAFGTTARGSNGATVIVMTVSNPAGNPTLNLSFALSGTNPTYWSRQTTGAGAGSDCGTTVAAGVTCNVRYRFNPPSNGAGGTVGAKSATVTVSSTTPSATFAPITSVTLSGTAN
jgi:hypothetical protein